MAPVKTVVDGGVEGAVCSDEINANAVRMDMEGKEMCVGEELGPGAAAVTCLPYGVIFETNKSGA
jgi:hypothetical protein